MAVSSTIMSIVLSAILQGGVDTDYTTKEVACLTEAVYFEAANRPLKEKVAVANVVMNRVKAGYAKTICGVTYQRGQFSFQRSNKASRLTAVNQDNIRESAMVALKVLDNQYRDNTMGATHFVNLRIATDRGWLKGMRMVVAIGPHTFYKERKLKHA